ncbi:MAG: EAL domain-containing protein [Cyanothece sp. SIO1E1]|nr:EAL domain-containing protein [Cyanothece sp. SIO1E1]
MIFQLSRQLSSLLSTAKNYWHRKGSVYVVYGRPVLIASVLVTGIVLGGRQTGILQSLELAAFDHMVRLQPKQEADSRLLVIEITESDIQNQNRWPLSDQVVAQLLKELQQHQPQAIGLDIYRDITHPPGHEALQEQLQAENVITIARLGGNVDGVSPPAGVPAARIGFNDFITDIDNVIRRNFIYTEVPPAAAWVGQHDKATVNDNLVPVFSFALRLSLSYLANQNLPLQIKPDAIYLGDVALPRLKANSGGYQLIAAEAQGWQVLLNYRSVDPPHNHQLPAPDYLARRVTLTQALNGEFDTDWVKNKVVLIGTTAPSEKDLFLTPYSAAKTDEYLMPGVLVHAQLVSQILHTVLDHQPLFWFWSQSGEILWIASWSLVGGILAHRLKHLLSLAGASILALGGLCGICVLAFNQAGWIPLVPAILTFVGTNGTILAFRVFYSAFHDALTGLPNRVLFAKQLRRAIAINQKSSQHAPLAVLFLDLDRFKVINESFGHEVGDQLLTATVSRLKSCLRLPDTVARVGGDEFAILLKQMSDVNEATSVADRLQKELTQPFILGDQEVFTTVSIGIALNENGYDQKPDDLLRDAHTAMYRAKALGKARHEVFATGMHAQAVTRLQLESDLRQAIKNQEFYLNYQPIISLKNARIAGFEALVRWQHPKRGSISPGEFIPVAEETGLIIPLGQWILRAACHQAHLWQQQFPMRPPLMISVNLSSRQFAQPDLVEQIEHTLKETHLEGQSLKIEITESMVMDNVEAAIDLLLQLKSLDLRLSIDDFGTGYSSLSYLHRFPLDTLKVDQSFVSQMAETGENAEIVRTIVMLGHNLGMDVIAEGIETSVQMKALQALGCEYGQGYFFAKPLSSEVAAALLGKSPAWKE